jgi:DNA polymerase III alpha subunit
MRKLGRFRLDMEGKVIYHVKMRTDTYGQIILSEDDLCDLYLKDPEKTFNEVLSEDCIQFSDSLNISPVPNITLYTDPKLSVAEFDRNNQNNWHMPERYKNMDIAEYVLAQCNNESELQRAGEELLLFQERDMFDLLKYLKYLVDTMRENNIIWGVGRGSSVSSFVLYLIGIHKINSLYYDLSIDEFLK